MALIVPTPPVDNRRRSPRISGRRQLHSHPQSSPTNLIRRTATPLPGSSPMHASALRPRTRHDSSYKSRSRVSSPAPLRQPRRAVSGAAIPIHAGAKRKRSSPTHSHDLSDRPQYKLVAAAVADDADAQTPRQLRYAKRQRLLTTRPGKDALTAEASVEDRTFVELGNTALPVGVVPPAGQAPPSRVTSPSHEENTAPFEQILAPTNDNVGSDVELADPDEPIFTPIHRRPLPRRYRSPDSTEGTIWKHVCQIRVQHVKKIYKDVFRAVVFAEALAAQQAYEEALAAQQEALAVEEAQTQLHAQVEVDVAEKAQAGLAPAEAQFELYTPTEFADEHGLDADGDITMDDAADEEDEDDDEDEGEDADVEDDIEDAPPPAYEQVIILNTPQTPPTNKPRLPRLSSIRILGLDGELPRNADGVAYIGRGTPVERQRLNEWAAPAVPIQYRAQSPAALSPEPFYFTPDMVPQVDMQTSSSPTSSVDTDMTAAFAMDFDSSSMSWLDPSLRADSVSPSPSPAPIFFPAFEAPMASGALTPAAVPQPNFGVPSAIDNTPSESSPTGCALHGSFLECLQAPGCAGPLLAGPSGPAPPYLPLAVSLPPRPSSPMPCATAVDTPPLIMTSFTAPPAVFPNKELTQFVRSHLVPGSVTLGHALG
ncbi:hypothetical protein BD413DRAFT_674380 [Trametes elegans]|nr:hypothetical protein BD413DRAFT_674380 [Trametes elegans]